MPRTKQRSVTSMHKSYDLDGWEGGIAVYGMCGEYGTRIIAIPRLQLSSCLTGYHDSDAVHEMLRLNRTLRNEPKQLNLMADRILSDFQNIESTESA